MESKENEITGLRGVTLNALIVERCTHYHMQWMSAKYGVPRGVRTPVTAVKGRCPRPLDDGD